VWDDAGGGCNVAVPNLPRREVGRAGVYWLALSPSARTSGGRLGTAMLQPPPASSHTPTISRNFSERFSKIQVYHTQTFSWVWGMPHTPWVCGKRKALVWILKISTLLNLMYTMTQKLTFEKFEFDDRMTRALTFEKKKLLKVRSVKRIKFSR